MAPAPRFLARLTTTELAALGGPGRPLVALVPVGSCEPHGPHLPLATDTLISEAAVLRACERLDPQVLPLIAPSVPYGVTDYARAFPGAVSIPAPALTAYLRAVIAGLHASGFAHVCLVNNHLEPAQDAAVRAALEGFGPAASVACPLTRRWARRLGDEFKRGECHAGAYETSLVLACAPTDVHDETAAALPDVPISLSRMIQAGVTTFDAMGLDRAYAGAPRLATAAEGARHVETLAEMVATEVLEAMGLAIPD
jgi:creatinine amidohydrolase